MFTSQINVRTIGLNTTASMTMGQIGYLVPHKFTYFSTSYYFHFYLIFILFDLSIVYGLLDK